MAQPNDQLIIRDQLLILSPGQTTTIRNAFGARFEGAHFPPHQQCTGPALLAVCKNAPNRQAWLVVQRTTNPSAMLSKAVSYVSGALTMTLLNKFPGKWRGEQGQEGEVIEDDIAGIIQLAVDMKAGPLGGFIAMAPVPIYELIAACPPLSFTTDEGVDYVVNITEYTGSTINKVQEKTTQEFTIKEAKEGQGTDSWSAVTTSFSDMMLLQGFKVKEVRRLTNDMGNPLAKGKGEFTLVPGLKEFPVQSLYDARTFSAPSGNEWRVIFNEELLRDFGVCPKCAVNLGWCRCPKEDGSSSVPPPHAPKVRAKLDRKAQVRQGVRGRSDQSNRNGKQPRRF